MFNSIHFIIFNLNKIIITFAVVITNPLYICIASALIISPFNAFANSIDNFVFPTPKYYF